MRRHRITKRLIAAAVVVGALAAGGAAFTNSNTLTDSVAGYGTSHITGATATDVVYTLSGDGTQINTVTITWNSDVSADTVEAGFNTNPLTSCTTTTTPAPSTSVCSGFTQVTATATTLNATVTNK